MSPLTVFLRTLAKSTAIFLGAGVIFLNPTLDLTGSRAVTAQKSPAEAAADVLIGALKDSDAGVRRQAAHSLGQMRSARAVPALIDAMKDENAEVRAQAMWALAEVEDRRATPAIAAALKDSDPKVRARAASRSRSSRIPLRSMRSSAPFATATSTCGRTSSGRSARLATRAPCRR